MVNALTIDLITRLIADSIITVKRRQRQVDVEIRRATNYVAETINENIQCQESLDVINSIPKFGTL